MGTVMRQNTQQTSSAALMTHLMNETDERNLDPVTGLPNAIAFVSAADACIQSVYTHSSNKRDISLALISFDIMSFRLYNAAQGYRRGDALLRMLARILEASFPESIVARMGDDRFAVLTAAQALERRIEYVDARVLHATAASPVHIKAGIYLLEANDTALAAHDKATLARMSIKKDYKALFGYFDGESWASLNRAHYLLSRIDDAIANACIRVYYQPIIDVKTSQVCAFEALARWEDPVLGFLPPSEFIEILESANLIHKLDLEVVRQVCTDLRGELGVRWPEIPVAVNLSRADFDACDIVGELERVVDAHDVDRKLIHLEITESALVDSQCALNEGIIQFKNEGYRLFMDDFGSGYSTLNVLKDYEFDTLKIDLRFLDCAEHTYMGRARSIISAVVSMAQSIGMHALAEGVETEEQLSFLKSIGCEMVQGYLFGKPQALQDMSVCAA